MIAAVRGVGYGMVIWLDDVDKLVVTALSLLLNTCQDAVWNALDFCPRSTSSSLMTMS